MPAEQAAAVMRALPDRSWLFTMEDFAPRAFEIAAEIDHPICDFFCLALAERERCPLVTANERLLGKVEELSGLR